MALLADAVEATNPFPGLRSFEPDEEHLFFGREQQVDELLAKLRQTQFLTVVGSSGSGKSSIVRSGLIPALYSGFMVGAGSGWRVAIARPGDDPIGNLASVLSDPEVIGGAEASRDLERSILGATLRRGARGLVEAVRQARLPGDENLLVLIDQFEEIFRFKGSEVRLDSADESSAFVKLLLEAASEEDSPIYVVLTMRSDFLGNCADFEGLPEAINRGLYLVPRMTRDQRRAAITGPVAVAGNEITPRLLLRLLNDVGDNPDQLPILQHALMRTWDYWHQNHTEDEPLDLRHYEAVGTLEEAMSLHAEEAYAELGASGLAAEKVFKCLTEKGIDGRGVRRPATLEEICEVGDLEFDEAVRVVEAFRRPGRSFLVPPSDVPLTPDRVIDISHESLMRVWRRLTQWVDEESQGAHLYRRLAEAAARHQAGEGALWRDPELQLALAWHESTEPTAAWASRYDPSFERAVTFLRLSRDEREGEIERREQRRRRQLFVSRMLAGGSLAALAVILVIGFMAVMAKQQAESERARALEASQEAEVAREEAELAQGAAEQSEGAAKEAARVAELRRQEAEVERLRAQTEAARAAREKRRAEEQSIRAQEAADDAIEQKRLADRAKGEADSSAQRALEARTEAERLQRIDLARSLASRQVARLLEENQPVEAALLALQSYQLADRPAWSPAIEDALRQALGGLAHKLGGDLAAATGDEAARLGEAIAVLDSGRDRQLLSVMVRDRGAEVAIGLRAVAMAGDRLVWGREDGVIETLTLSAAGSTRREIAEVGASVRTLAVVAGGRLAVGDAAGRLSLVRLEGGSGSSERLLDAGPVVHVVTVGPSGELAAGLGDGTVRRWRPAAGGGFEPLDPWTVAPGVRIRALAFDGGGRLAVGGDDGVVRVERAAGVVESADLGAAITAIAALGPDGLAIGTFQGRIVRWQPDVEGKSVVLVGFHRSAVNDLARLVRPDASAILASAGSDGEVLLWPLASVEAAAARASEDAEKGLQAIVLEGHSGWVWSLAAAADGSRLYSAAADGTLWSWVTGAAELSRTLCSSRIEALAERGWRLDSSEWQRNVESLDYDQQRSPCEPTR